MKKAIVLLLALVAVGGLVFAIDAPAPTYTLTADASVKWQYDLDAAKSGFTNSYNLSFKYFLMDGGKKTTAGAEGDTVFGQIDITELNLMVKEVTDKGLDNPIWKLDDHDGNNIGIAAKIVVDALTVTIYGGPSGSYDNAVYVPLFSKDSGYSNSSTLHAKIGPGAGLKIGYSLGDLGTATVGVGSKTAGAVNAFDQYAFGLDLALTPVKDVLAVNAGVWYGKGMVKDDHNSTAAAAVAAVVGTYGDFGTAANTTTASSTITGGDMIMTGKVKLTSGDLTAYGAIDAANGTKFNFDVSGGVTYSLFEKKDSLNLDFYYSELASFVGSIPATKGHKGDVGFKFVDAGGLVAPLNFTVGVYATDLMASPANNPLLLSVAGELGYKVMLDDVNYVKPYVKVRDDFSGTKSLYVQGGVDAVIVKNVTLNANFVTGASKDDNNNVFAAAGNKVITVSAKVTL